MSQWPGWIKHRCHKRSERFHIMRTGLALTVGKKTKKQTKKCSQFAHIVTLYQGLSASIEVTVGFCEEESHGWWIPSGVEEPRWGRGQAVNTSSIKSQQRTGLRLGRHSQTVWHVIHRANRLWQINCTKGFLRPANQSQTTVSSLRVTSPPLTLKAGVICRK